ncbi:MAG: hypothetical protein WBZ05_12640 [Desulfobacterales bacterium]|jgi:hypothetical protein
MNYPATELRGILLIKIIIKQIPVEPLQGLTYLVACPKAWMQLSLIRPEMEENLYITDFILE